MPLYLGLLSKGAGLTPSRPFFAPPPPFFPSLQVNGATVNVGIDPSKVVITKLKLDKDRKVRGKGVQGGRICPLNDMHAPKLHQYVPNACD